MENVSPFKSRTLAKKEASFLREEKDYEEVKNLQIQSTKRLRFADRYVLFPFLIGYEIFKFILKL